ncbi:MAG: hypothetical protein ACREJ5_01185 [Geminicoccaceae bacterium]
MDDQLGAADLDRVTSLGPIAAYGDDRTVSMLNDPAGTAVTAGAGAREPDGAPIRGPQQTRDCIQVVSDMLPPRAEASGQARQLLKRWPQSC